MNALLLNRDGFQMPTDGWYQVAPLGEFAHAQAGLVQVVDPEACAAMVNRFADEAKGTNFAGLLVDFDHFSLDGEKRSEAAGWITELENRDGGLFAKIRWSDVGEEAVKGGRYRFLSPVWSRSDCVDLGNGRVRPVRLLNAAVTNDPNLKGMQPLSNRGQSSEVSGQGETTSTAKGATDAKGNLVNAGGAEPRFKWVLGDTPEGRHCPSCTAVAGQVHTMAEWDTAGVKPGAAVLCCQGNCKCQLSPTGDAAGGVLQDVPVRKEDAIENRGGTATGKQDPPPLRNTGWTNEARVASLEVRRAKALRRSPGGDAARDARLRERQQASMEKASKDYAAIYETKGLDGMSAEEVTYMTARVGRRIQNGSVLTDTEKRFVREMKDRGAGDGLGEKEKTIVQNRERGTAATALANIGWTDAARAASLAVRQAKAAAHGGAGGGFGAGAAGGRSAVLSLLSKGYSSMTPDEVRKVAKALQAKAKTGADFTPEELTFLQDSIDDPNAIPTSGAGGHDGAKKAGGKAKKRDPELGPTDYQTWYEENGLSGMPQKAVDSYADQLRAKMSSGDEPLTETETKFLGEITDKGYEGLNNDDPILQWQVDRSKKEARMRQATGMSSQEATARVNEIETRMDALQPVTPEEEAFADAYHKVKSMPNRQCRRDDDAPYIMALVNTGWTDQSRVAALAVRRAKVGARGEQAQMMPPGKVAPPVDGGIYTGGSKYFDESTGQYRKPVGGAAPGRTVQPAYPVKPGQTAPRPVQPAPPGWGGKPAYPVKRGQPLPPPYVPPRGGTPPVSPKRPAPPKKGQPVPITPPYRFLSSGARRAGAGSR